MLTTSADSRQPLDMQKPLSVRGIKGFVGRVEVADALGVSTKMLGRMVSEGKFPRPVQLSANRDGWSVDVVQDHLRSLFEGVTRAAVADPSKLKPDQVADALQQLGARHASAAGDLIGVNVRMTSDEAAAARTAMQAAAQAHEEQIRDSHASFGRLDFFGALVVAAALMPSIRELAIKTFEHSTGTQITLSDRELMQTAMHLLEDAANTAEGAPQQQS